MKVAGSSRCKPERLFVYGTLLDNARVDELIGGHSVWRRIASATISGRLYDVGPYPALRRARDSRDRVLGVVIELEDGRTAIPRLDAYEDMGFGLYVRRRCLARLSGGRSVAAWVYEYSRSVRGLRRIVSGDWTRQGMMRSFGGRTLPKSGE
jgi:gamma-glutamylcyclotransferase (GGCT)/AIG2-like uncharacterized protein YtfP